MKRYNLTKLEVMLVEDNAFMRRLMRGILRELGIRKVRDAEDFDTALNIHQVSGLDLVFTNWSPELNVLDFLKTVRRGDESPNPEVPIIVITAFTEVHHVLAGRDAGCNEFLAKPVSAETIYQRICNVIENQRPFIRSEHFVGPDRRRKNRPINHADRRGTGVYTPLEGEAPPEPAEDSASASEESAPADQTVEAT